MVGGEKEKFINPFAHRKTRIVYNFGLPECNKVKLGLFIFTYIDTVKPVLRDLPKETQILAAEDR